MDNETIVLINNNKIPEIELEKYFALKALKENPGILGNFFTFEKLVYVLNNIKPNVDVWEPPSILMVAKAINELNKLGQLPQQWESEVKEYISQLAYNEGWISLPEILGFAQNELDNIQPEKLDLTEQMKQLQELKHLAVREYLK